MGPKPQSTSHNVQYKKSTEKRNTLADVKALACSDFMNSAPKKKQQTEQVIKARATAHTGGNCCSLAVRHQPHQEGRQCVVSVSMVQLLADKKSP